MHNADVAAAFDEITDLLELEDAYPFSLRAYHTAARVVGDLGREVAGLVRAGEDLITRRGPIEVDLPRVLRHARERGCFAELDAHPERLDLDDLQCRMARDEGILVSIGSDAHGVHDFDHLRFGVGQARRGWLEKADVLNTRTLAELRPTLARTMGRGAG